MFIRNITMVQVEIFLDENSYQQFIFFPLKENDIVHYEKSSTTLFCFLAIGCWAESSLRLDTSLPSGFIPSSPKWQ